MLGGKAIADDGRPLQASAGWELDLWGRVKRETEAAQVSRRRQPDGCCRACLTLTADVPPPTGRRALVDESQVLGVCWQ